MPHKEELPTQTPTEHKPPQSAEQGEKTNKPAHQNQQLKGTCSYNVGLP
jgi:hypothetical protein